MYKPGLHRLAIVLAASTFILIVAGALVTSNNAGLAVPDWPTSFGSLYKIPPMVGGVKYEHGHRMIAQFVGFLTIVLAVWLQRSDPRPWMRKLGWTALALVIIQGIFGGLTVLHLLPWWVSTIHGILAQTYFSLTMLFVIFLGRRWLGAEVQAVPQQSGLDLLQLSSLAILLLYLQLFFGAAFRHSAQWKIAGDGDFVFPFMFHVFGAVAVTAMVFWMSIRALTAYGSIRPLRGMAIAVLALLLIQVGLGFAAYLTRVLDRNAIAPTMAMVHTTVTHVSVGALLMAHCFMFAAQVRRYLLPHSSRVAENRTVPA